MKKPLTTGEIIKRVRQEHKMTQEMLAKELGLKKTTIQKYENGMVQNIKIETLRKISRLFQLPPWMLLFPEKLEEFDLDWSNVSPVLSENIGKKDIEKIFLYLSRLNINGRKKVMQYTEDLYQIPNYVNEKMKFQPEITRDYKGEKESETVHRS